MRSKNGLFQCFSSITEYISFRCLSYIDILSEDICSWKNQTVLLSMKLPKQLGCLEEHRELPLWDLGQSPRQKLISVHSNRQIMLLINWGPVIRRLLLENRAFCHLGGDHPFPPFDPPLILLLASRSAMYS